MTAEDTGREATVRPEPGGRRSARLRLRAAWMYYVEGMTQNAIAETLGIGRVTVVRLLADARAMREVKVSISRDVSDLPRLEIELQKRFGIHEAIVAPLGSRDADPTAAIGAATGRYLSDVLKPNMRLGVGWGQTLLGTLGSIDVKPLPGISVVSLLGGISAVHYNNPAEFVWQFSRLLHADCYLVAAPALVDSAETKAALVERCGIGAVFEQARSIDAALLSVGSMAANSTAHLFGYISEAERRELIAGGAVGDLLYNFFDETGQLLDHPVNQRVMSVSPGQLAQAPRRILASGGPDKVRTLLGAIRLLRPTVLITDETTANAVLALATPAD